MPWYEESQLPGAICAGMGAYSGCLGTFGIQAMANQTASSMVYPHCITTNVVLIRTARPARRSVE